jgi:hypothetical protein
MRSWLSLLAIAALASLTGTGACNRAAQGSARVAIPAAETTAAGPAMAAGLWRQRVAGPRGAQVTTYCLDAGASGALASFNQQLSGRCDEHQMALSSDGAWRFRTACDAGTTGKVVTEGVMRGDFARHYSIDVTRKIESGVAGAAGAARLSVDVRWLGDCPAGMKPGDVILPGGARGRLGDLPANA